MDNKERYISILKSTQREGIDEMISWLETTDFYTAPASHCYHGSYPGGLVEHHLNVFDEAMRLLSAYPEINVPEASVAIATLTHDYCKINFYKSEKRNRKNEAGAWEQYDAYAIKEKFAYGGHGSKSVYLVQHFIQLTPDEAVAINCHMGSWDGNKDVGKAFEQCSFAWLVHVADESATFIKERKDGKSNV